MERKIEVKEVLSKDGKCLHYSLHWGRKSGQRKSTGLFSFVKPKDVVERRHNEQTRSKLSKLIQRKEDELNGIIASAENEESDFMDYYERYVIRMQRAGNRHLRNSLTCFTKFVGVKKLKPSSITEDLCKNFRNYLLDNYGGKTPHNYFSRFKQAITSATKAGYFRINPCAEVIAKSNPSYKKEILDMDEWKKLVDTPATNNEVKKAAIFSLYTGLRWCDINSLTWEDVREKSILKVQEKTKFQVEVPLHPAAIEALGERKTTGKVFHLPTQDGCNASLRIWVKDAGIGKKITWHCFRHSCSVLLQRSGVDLSTVAKILGHTNLTQVMKTYQQSNNKMALEAIMKLPSLENNEEKSSVPVVQFSNDRKQRMRELKEMHDEGLISKEQYEATQNEILRSFASKSHIA